MKQDKFIERSIKIHNGVYDYSKVVYLNNKSKVLIICSKHGEFWQRPDHHLKGHVCKKCGYETVASKQTYDLNEMIKSFCKIHNNKYNYDKIQKENYKTQFSYIEIFCPKHGIFKQKAYYHLIGSGCKKCYQSKGEKLINEFLEKNLIEFKREFKFKHCKDILPLPFDFFLPNLNVCIEYDGLQHFKPIKRYGGEENFKKTKKHDEIKNKFCLDNNITLFRISYKENIEEKMLLIKKTF